MNRFIRRYRCNSTACLLYLFFFSAVSLFASDSKQKGDSLLQAYEKAAHRPEEAVTALHGLVRHFLSINKPDSAHVFLMKAFAEGKDVNNPLLKGTSYYLKGKLYLTLMDYDQSMISFIEADKMYKAGGAKKEHALTEMQFGILLYAQQNYKAAADYYSSAHQLLTEVRDTFNSVTSKYLLGLAHVELNEFEKAEQVLREALALSRQYRFAQREMECHNGLAELYLRQNRNEESLQAAQIALNYYMTEEEEGSPDQSGKARSEFIIGKSAAGLGRFELAASMLEKALAHEQLGRRYEACVKISEALIHVYDYMQQYKKAIEQVQYMLQWKDSLKKAESDQTIRILTDRQNIQLQNSKIELLTSQQESDKRIRLSLIAFAVLFLVLAVTWYQKFRDKKASERRVDELLLNILPAEVAGELKSRGSAGTKSYAMVSVMFVDIVAFTKMSERLSPEMLVTQLNTYFTAFDRICQRFHLEKIKTLGDAYMCAGGVPVENTTHAFDIIAAAKEIMAFIEEQNIDRPDEERIQVRIGIHSGPVVAGVVGIRKFAYDIWGDTVNIAARMEQASEPGCINISESTYSMVKGAVACNSRGKINAKYKGEINMYYVV